MITFEQFKKEYRDKEKLEGTKQMIVNRHLLPQDPATDEELREWYEALQSEAQTGVQHHGTIIDGNEGVLTLKNLGA